MTSNSKPAYSSLVGSADARDREILFNVAADEIHLGIGAPDHGLLARAAVALTRATHHAFQTDSDSGDSSDSGASDMAVSALQYGPPLGSRRFLRLLATFLTEQYAYGRAPAENPVNVDDAELMVTAGASQGLAWACSLFARPGSLVVMEDPAYFIASRVFAHDFGLRIATVPMDEDGMRVDALESLLEREVGSRAGENSAVSSSQQQQQQRPQERFSCIVYTIPTFHNPTTTVLSEERRHRLVELARQYSALVVCDDVYECLSFGSSTDDDKGPRRHPPRVVSLDRSPGHVLSNGSFSKIFGPGVRLGWIEAKQDLLSFFENSGFGASGGSPNHLMAGIFSSMLKLGLETELLGHLRKTYAARSKAICDLLRQDFPEARFTEPRGGFFLWVQLPESLDAEDLLAKCREKHRVGFQPGNWSSLTKSFPHHIRIAFTFYEEETLKQGISQIIRVAREMLQ